MKCFSARTNWNNYVGMVPKNAVPGSTGSNMIMTAGGFLVPGKQTGEIDLWEVSVFRVIPPSSPIMPFGKRSHGSFKT
jgi:hypothetical protein